MNYYVIDTSSLINLKPFASDVFPTIWANLDSMIKSNRLISHKTVLNELKKQDDGISDWANKHKSLFADLDATQITILQDILGKYPSLAKSDREFDSADPFLIALTIELNSSTQMTLTGGKITRTLVTEEELDGNKLKIPFICDKYGIKCINLMQMFRDEGWIF